MRLRTRLAQDIQTRLAALLPEALETVWDHAAVLVVIEQLRFTSAGGLEGGWNRMATFDGFVRLELRADTIDALVMEPLIADLVANLPFLEFEPTADVGRLSEKARLVLLELRDTIRDQDLATQLRLEVHGTLAKWHGATVRPELLISPVPDIGFGNEGAYTPIGGGT